MNDTKNNSATIDIAHLANLARLLLNVDEQQNAETQLGNIIAMIDAMQAIDTQGVEPMAHPLDATQRLRPDEVTEQVDPNAFQAIAPATQDGYYLVPRVVE